VYSKKQSSFINRAILGNLDLHGLHHVQNKPPSSKITGILCTLTTPWNHSDQLTHYSKGDMNWLTHPGCFKRDFDDFMAYPKNPGLITG